MSESWTVVQYRVLTWNLSTGSRDRRMPTSLRQPDVCIQFKVSLNYTVRPCLQNNNNQIKSKIELAYPRGGHDNHRNSNNHQNNHKMIKFREHLLCTKCFIHIISLRI